MDWSLNRVRPPEAEFSAAQRMLGKHCDAVLFDKPLKTWFTATDRHLFKGDACQSLRSILARTFADVSEELANDGMSIVILVAAVRRACNTLVPPLREAKHGPKRRIRAEGTNMRESVGDERVTTSLTNLPVSAEQAQRDREEDLLQRVDPDCIPAGLWAGWCQNINSSKLDHFPLGFYARSLQHLPSRLWNVRISTYCRRSLAEIKALGGHGKSALLAVVKIIGDLAHTLDQLPRESHSRVLIMPSAILEVTTWISGVLRRGLVPQLDSIVHGLTRPLLVQLDIDLGPQVSEMVERRIGLDGHPQTFDEIAHDFGLTRERIRQQTNRAIAVLKTRWPEGKYLLDDFYDLLRGSHRAQEQVDLVRKVVDVLFEFEYVRTVSHTEIHDAWERLGKQKRTPMTESDIQSWLASEFPLVPPDVALPWIKDHALVAPGADGENMYFTKAPHDLVLHELQRSRTPMTLADASEIIGDEERNVRLRLERDPRFVEDEYRRILAAENCSFVRVNGGWHIRLQKTTRSMAMRSESICLERLSQLICTGLIELGVADATVWGVHRYANKVLGQMRYGQLPPEVSPFVFANRLVQHSNGMIRIMRRRRLRWDDSAATPPARGKLGWVGHVVGKIAVPMTLRELDAALRTYYQDYEWFVLTQLSLDEEEDGEHYCGARTVSGYTRYLPALIVPFDWHLDVAHENVSDEIKLLAARIIAAGTKRGYPKKVLEDVPWLVQLVECYSYGRMKWSDDCPPRDESVKGDPRDDHPPDASSPHPGDVAEPTEIGRADAAERIQNLLARLL